MAWQDLLGGLAGGLSQGLGQVQQNVESSRRTDHTNKELMLRALQERRAMEAEQRRQLLEQFGLLEEEVEVDPSNPMVAAAGPGAFVKSPSGKGLMKKKSTAAKTADLNYDEAVANQPLKAGERKSAQRTQDFKNRAFAFLERKYGPDWVDLVTSPKMDVKDRGLAGTALIGNQEAFLGQDETTAAINARTSAQGNIDTARIYAGRDGSQKVLTPDQALRHQREVAEGYLKVLGDPTSAAGRQLMAELRDVYKGDQRAHLAAYMERFNLGGPNVAGPAAGAPGAEIVYDSTGKRIQ